MLSMFKGWTAVVAIAAMIIGVGAIGFGARAVYTTIRANAINLERETARAAGLAAELQMMRAAKQAADEVLAWREQQLVIATAANDRLVSHNEELRANAPKPDEIVFAADDPWLAAKRRSSRIRSGPAAAAGAGVQSGGRR